MPRTTMQENLSSKNTAAKLRLGQGIYFAKDPVTSLKYTSPTRDGRLYLFVAGALSAWAISSLDATRLSSDDRLAII